MARSAGLMVAQVFLVLLCIAFTLMSACGGLFLLMSFTESGDYEIAPIGGGFLVICGAIAFGIGVLIRKLHRKWMVSD